MSRLQESERLHCAVRSFAHDALAGRAADETFDRLLRDIARFQESAADLSIHSPAHGSAVPLPTPCVVDAFRAGSVFAFEEQYASACFETSGTTGAESGRHFMRTTTTYAALAVEWGRRALVPQGGPPLRVVALMPEPTAPLRSSLAFMCARFMEAFDQTCPGPPTGTQSTGTQSTWTQSSSRHFDQRWLMGADGIHLPAFREHVRMANEAGQALLVLATSFSLVMLLDALGAEQLPLPPGSVVMQTGGFKGKTREIPAADLNRRLHAVLCPLAVVGEYGMTELSSQLYEGRVPGAELVGPEGVYLPPPWLRVLALDPLSFRPVPAGNEGLAAFIDLANVDSAVFVVTQDLIRLQSGGVVLLGRRPRAPLRGCSLSTEAVWLADGGVQGTTRTHLPATQAGPKPSSQVRDVSTRAALGDGADEVDSQSSAMARVRRLVNAARRIADPDDPLGQEARQGWTRCTELSPEAIELGVRCSLETEPSDDELRQLVSSMPAAGVTWVLLSANVFVAALRAIATALASSRRVRVRPSRRDPILAQMLHVAAPDLFELVDELRPAAGDQVHAYGSDQTRAELQASLPRSVQLHFHGSGLGAAVIGKGADVGAAVRGLALDTVLFEQRGCLSPRVVVLSAEFDATDFAQRMAAELQSWAQRVPQAGLSLDERMDITWHRALVQRVGMYVETSSGSVSLLPPSVRRLFIPPVGRNLVLRSETEPLAVLEQLGSALTCVGCAGESIVELRRRLPHARVCELGRMQRPPFDGPVDRRPTR